MAVKDLYAHAQTVDTGVKPDYGENGDHPVTVPLAMLRGVYIYTSFQTTVDYEREVTLNSRYTFDFDWRQKIAAPNL